MNIETKIVIAGPHGPVPTEENTRRYIGDQPTTVPMSTYYLRRMMSGELVEYVAPAEQPMTMVAEPAQPVVLTGSATPPIVLEGIKETAVPLGAATSLSPDVAAAINAEPAAPEDK